LTTGLRIEHLWLVAFLAGVLTACFDVAHPSLLPSVVRRNQLVDANSRFELSRSGALIAGPGLAGLLVQWLTAPVAILADAASFVVSAVLVGRVRITDRPAQSADRQGLWAEARAGLRLVLRDPVLSAMATSLCVFNLFANMISAVYVLFLTRDLGFSAATVGLILAAGSVAFPVGAVAAGWGARRFGIGGAIVWGAGISDAGFLLLPLAGGPSLIAIAVLISARLIATIGGPITAINQLSLRQAVTPAHLLGRVNGAMMTIGLGAAPLGALLGGVLGDALGLRATVLIGAVGLQLGFVRLLWSPVRAVQDVRIREGTAAGSS
jgi:predicted MFS family arabinose efflux permease